jgi:hypothetical protein
MPIPVVRFSKADRKIEVMMRPYLDAQAATGRSGVVAATRADSPRTSHIHPRKHGHPGPWP